VRARIARHESPELCRGRYHQTSIILCHFLLQAMEVRQALRERSDLHPNTITYSVGCICRSAMQSGRFPETASACLHRALHTAPCPHCLLLLCCRLSYQRWGTSGRRRSRCSGNRRRQRGMTPNACRTPSPIRCVHLESSITCSERQSLRGIPSFETMIPRFRLLVKLGEMVMHNRSTGSCNRSLLMRRL